MHLCVDVSGGATDGLLRAVADGVSCASYGLADYVGAMSGLPPLSLDEINQLATACMLLWATCFMLRVIRRMIPKGIG